jgi:hypothetical protein
VQLHYGLADIHIPRAEIDQVMDATSLPKVKMPNRDGFVADPRPDVGKKIKR